MSKLEKVLIVIVIIILGLITFSYLKAEAKQVEPINTMTEATESVSGTRSVRTSGSYVKKPQFVWQVVKFGDISEDVKTFQKMLNYQINAGLVVDGVYGNLTESAWQVYKLTLK